MRKKKIILCGDEKYLQDVEDFFEGLTIEGYLCIDEQENTTIFRGEHPIHTLENYAKKINQTHLIVVCSFNTKAYSILLEHAGLHYGREYIYGEDLIKTIDEEIVFTLAQNYPSKKVIVMGTGKYCSVLMEKNPHLQINYFIDNDEAKVGETIYNRPIKKVEALEREQQGQFVVVVAAKSVIPIKRQLKELGLRFGEDFFFVDYESLISDKIKASKLLLETIRAEPAFDLSCDITTRAFNVTKTGECEPCCGMETVPLGNLLYESIDGILKSARARIVWLSTVNKTYTFCNSTCGKLNIPANIRITNSSLTRRLYPRPTVEELRVCPCYDDSCNLACPSCRTNKRLVPSGNIELITQINDEMRDDVILRAKEVFNGNGEMFYAKLLRETFFGDHATRKEITIQTNGLLFNPQNWEMVRRKYEHIKLMVSIDAATEETYQKLRGGNFEQLLQNLRFAGELRRQEELDYLKLQFVVQRDNYREMPNFIRMAESVGADHVLFTRIRNWGSYSAKDFEMIDVLSPQHPENAMAKQVLEDPMFTKPIVELMDGAFVSDGL